MKILKYIMNNKLTFLCDDDDDGTLIVKTKCKLCKGYYHNNEYENNVKCLPFCKYKKKVCKKCKEDYNK
jgi:acetyl-CoA carboxylase beta subunit